MKGNKVYRVTFSKSLADYIAGLGQYRVEVVQLYLGKELKEGDKSKALYAVCKASNLWPLRVTFFHEAAEMWRNYSTKVYECYLKIVPS